MDVSMVVMAITRMLTQNLFGKLQVVKSSS